VKALKQQNEDVKREFNMRLTDVSEHHIHCFPFFLTEKKSLCIALIKTCACVVQQIVTQFKMQGVNTALYYKNKEMEDTFNIVPTSAVRFVH
jgi:translation initiation factor 5B